MTFTDQRRVLRGLATAGLIAVALGGCGSAVGLTTSKSTSGSMSAMTSSSSTGGMNMGSGGSMKSTNPMGVSPHTLKVDGITPVPTQTLLTSDWQHMKITAMAMTAVPFVIFTGTKLQRVPVPRHVSFHLMITLQDDRTNVPIPYASVWATITKGNFSDSERQWPMISEYLGPHYGNNVVLPGPGHYQLKLLVSPPASARHLEYQDVWLKPHTVTASFNWSPPKS